MRQPAVSLVILCHNDGAYLRGCLKSVFVHTKDVPYEIVIVNNATGDDCEGWLDSLARRKGRLVRVIHNKENRYFAGGNNQGVRASRGRHVLLLNADTVVGPQWLSRMLRVAESAPDIGLVAPYTNGATGPQWVREPGYTNIRQFSAFARRWAEARDGRVREAHRVIGFCLLMTRKALDQVGLLDERFGPGGYEDYDYCLRVQQAGLRCVIAEDVFVHHFGGKGYVGMDYGHHRRVNREILARKWAQFVFHALDDMDRVVEDAAALAAAGGRR